MFNPSDLLVVVGSSPEDSSFVGVRRGSNKYLEFCIPIGFTEFPKDDSKAVNRLFFDLYKVFRRFTKDKEEERRGIPDDQIDSSRDGNVFHKDGFSFTDKDGELVTIYSKIPMLEAVLESYDDLKVFLLTGRDTKTNQVDYTKIHRYLSKAIYLEDDTAFVDTMVAPKPVVYYDVSDLVRMYCFIYLEIKRALNEEATLQNEIKAQAEIFAGQHLWDDSGLFVESHETTIALLKESLAEIHRQVTYKDSDYWYFFEVVEHFLYGDVSSDQEGENWGISRFSAVWETMCIEWMFDFYSDKIVFADSPTHSEDKRTSVYVSKDFANPFYIQCGDRIRHLRPDLVMWNNVPSRDEYFEGIFDITLPTPLSPLTYKIKLLKKTENSKNWFSVLLRELDSSGFRLPSMNNEQPVAIIRGISPAKFHRAVTLVKAKMEVSNARRGIKRSLIILDFKYVSKDIYMTHELNRKADADVKKQSIYEAAVILNEAAKFVYSQLCVPKFYSTVSSTIAHPVSMSELNSRLVKRGMQVMEVDYSSVSERYVSVR